MNCISFLKSQGLQVSARGKRVVVSPRAKVTSEVRQYIQRNRLIILAELDAGDGKVRRTYWRIKLPGAKSFPMIGEPMTQEEALSAALGLWPDAELEEPQPTTDQQQTARCADD